MSNADLTLKPIQKLLNEEFFVPTYQRGYRWSEVEVTDLLKDLNDFRKSPKPTVTNADKKLFYCLQPVVVKKTEDGLWEVIDGQQRLTTILLILHYLNQTEFKTAKPIYSIDYATKMRSKDFLKQLESEEFRFQTPDTYHLHEAYATIKSWFDEMEAESTTIKGKIYETLVDDSEVIWYDISNTNESAIDVFTRLNVGKIPLTNAELIKALFLRKANFEDSSADLKQIQIAAEWDMMESTLQQDDFWYFIYNKDNPIKYETRIEFIFDLIYNRKPKDPDRYTYNQFADEFRNLNRPKLTLEIDIQWQQIKRYFLTIEQWYRSPKWYHLIGYLVATGESLRELKDKATDMPKDEFEKYLRDQISEKVEVNVDNLNYGKDNKKIRNVLLLFNIETILKSKSADVRFPFDRFKKYDWDIEHIASQTDLPIKSTQQQKAWIEDVVDYLTGTPIYSFDSEQELKEKLPDELSELGSDVYQCYHAEKIDDAIFNPIRAKVEVRYKEDKLDPELKDSIGNLALLDDRTNRSYKNALFPIKRKRIIQNDSTGVMVPLCTKNVFMKFYSHRLSEVMFWQDDDIESYIKAIKTKLIDYLPEQQDKKKQEDE